MHWVPHTTSSSVLIPLQCSQVKSIWWALLTFNCKILHKVPHYSLNCTALRFALLWRPLSSFLSFHDFKILWTQGFLQPDGLPDANLLYCGGQSSGI